MKTKLITETIDPAKLDAVIQAIDAAAKADSGEVVPSLKA